MFVRLLFSFYFCVKRVIFFHGSCFPGDTRRGSASPFSGGSPFLGNLYAVHTSCVSNTPFPGWSFAVCGRTRGMDTYGFHPSCEFPRFPFGQPRSDGTFRSYLEVGPKKENGSTVTTQ